MNISFNEILNLENEQKILNAENTEGEDYIIFRGFFGNSMREIFANVLQDNNLELKIRINPDTQKKSFYYNGSYYKYFLSKDLIQNERRIYSVEDNVASVLYMIGYLSDSYINLNSSGIICTLIGKSNHLLAGATDSGSRVFGKYFTPLTEEERKDHDIEKRSVKLDNVPLITIKPIPDVPKELVEEQIKDFEKVKKEQEERYQKINEDDFRRLENLGPKINTDDINKKLKEPSINPNDSKRELSSNRYNVYKGILYIHSGDFKYKEQIDDIIESYDFDLAEKIARVFYEEKKSPLAENLSLKEILKRSAVSALERVSSYDIDTCSCGLMTAYNNSGILTLEFNPLPKEGFCPESVKEKMVSLEEIFKVQEML